MSKIIEGVVISAALLLCLPSCAPAISLAEYDALQNSLDNAQREIEELTEDMAALQADYDSLQADYESLLERLQQAELENLTWSELKSLLERDDTDTLPYSEGSFDCSGFAMTLRDRAWRYGIRCAYVEVGFSQGEGHALNAFETTDKGLIYVDDTKADQIAYVEVGQPYGTIHLDSVKFEYIACNGNPNEFWDSLVYTIHPDPFSYDYYLDYQERLEFYQRSVEAYNEAVDEYNNGSKKWSYAQLITWHDNLEELEQDLGSIVYKSEGVVKSTEVYWN